MSELLEQLTVRDSVRDDLPEIVAIFNEAIPGRAANAELNPVTVDSRIDWFEAHTPDKHPLWVVHYGDEMIGWISLSKFLPRYAYHITAELSVYLKAEWHGKGIGSWLLGKMIDECPRLGIENIVSLVYGHNQASIRMNEKHGFTQWGLLPQVTEMEGVYRDVVILGRKV